ncbi:DUF1801 domain-containing protein [Amycolatopsis solani]|uniref:DUF1801 domain-containing protein n=1 Tax=Amycolatopsis solani TaxID=3028615 RepID=UPI00296FAA1A|nr:DUF1801 domain-containing protein [Amycolatopsis sp. MEP2-6]
MTHEEYFAALAEPRRGELRALHELIRECAPDLAPTMEFGVPGYGRYHYRYASGREGDAATVSLASRKSSISLYVSCVAGDRYLPELFADRLNGASVGKSCVRFKRLSDVDIGVLAELLRAAAEHPPAGAV